MSRVLSAADLIDRLDNLRSTTIASAMAFDADGTLWSGDVGEDVFEHAVEQSLIRSEATEALEAMLVRYDVRPGGRTPADAARALLAAFRRGRVSHHAACELMTWGYAGFSLDELSALARQVFDARRLADRRQKELDPILSWARAHGIRTIIVSASPRPVVEIAALGLGFERHDIVAADPVVRAGRIEGAMLRPLPFGPTKRDDALALLDGAKWLAAFGDSDYDLDMMRAASIGVAVRPKPSLLALLDRYDDVVILSEASKNS